MAAERRKPAGKKIKKRNVRRTALIVGAALLAVIILGTILVIIKYAPTQDHMALEDFYALNGGDEAAVVVNAQLPDREENAPPSAVVSGDDMYIELSFLKKYIDDGYVYDNDGGVLRYTTDTQVISAADGSRDYTVGRDQRSLDTDIMMSENDTLYVNLKFIELFTDITYRTADDPPRAVIEKAGFEKAVTTLKKDAAIRRYGGPKSKILKDGKKGESVIILEDYGKWSNIATEDGIIGCVKNRYLNASTEEETPMNLPEREYHHILLDEKVCMGWHQVTNQTANGTLSDTLANTSGMNVISPTWFYISDNDGNISNIASAEYVSTCHAAGLQVWGLVSDLEDTEVDPTQVLNRTAARDTLVNNLVAAAIAVGMDGINVDFERVSAEDADGYIQFIRELSIKCENNELVLSVDNYKPTGYSDYYNRAEQAKYADYVIVMAYDEYTSGSEEAGSTSSIGFVTESAVDTLEEVPKEQLILGLPFFTRTWATDGTTLTSESIGMKDIPAYLEEHAAESEWREDVGQNFAEFTEDGQTVSIWIEDTDSMSLKLDVAKDNDLAGAAFWKLGFEPSSIWQTIESSLGTE